MHIRKMTLGDLETVITLDRLRIESGISSATFPRDYLALCLQMAVYICLVAEEAGGIIGFALASINEASNEVGLLDLCAKDSRKEVGILLFERIQSEARGEQDRTLVFIVSNPDIERLIDRMGSEENPLIQVSD